jgi:WhiB family redox-sensing transcriptional regulator
MDISQALCAQIAPDLYFPEDMNESLSSTSIAIKKLCVKCPIAVACLDKALSYSQADDWGIWGGTSMYERIKLRKNKDALETYKQYLLENSHVYKTKGEAA